MTRTRLTLTNAVFVVRLLIVAFLSIGNGSVAAESSHELAGRVVDADGAPVANALVAGRLTYDEPIRELGQTDEEGRFHVQLDESADPDTVWLFVRADGFGPTDARGEEFNAANAENSDATLTLRRSVPIRGQLIDVEGRPTAGVRVRPYRILRFGEDRRPPLSEAADGVQWVRELERKGRTVMYVDPSTELLLPWVETDDDGRFIIDSVGPDCLAGLMALGTRVEATTILVRTDDGDAFNLRYERGQPELTVHAHDNVRQTVRQSVPVMGKVVEAETGQPIPGVMVSPWRGPRFSFFRAERLIASTTDANGDYALLGLPLGK
ncbi:MAG: carboxypeptidase regulatory-like domain-containing protein, partial [Maioricimonas sp. JB049]